jgi:membrane protease YdiL (CAAX protease family)
MLTPGQPHSPLVLAAVLAALLALLVVRALRKDRKEYSRFKRYRSSIRRQAMFRKWLIESFSVFGGAAIVVLALAWQYVPLMLDDVEAWPATRWFRALMTDGGGLATAIVAGAALVIVAGSVLAIYLARRSEEVPAIGDITALLPRNRAELRYGAALSLNAGIVEELLFRLALPALLFGITDSAVIAVAGSVIVFGMLHVYQGVWGVLGSTVIGALLMGLYLASGSILVAMVAHALIDLRSLVLIPMMVFGVHSLGHGNRVGQQRVEE